VAQINYENLLGRKKFFLPNFDKNWVNAFMELIPKADFSESWKFSTAKWHHLPYHILKRDLHWIRSAQTYVPKTALVRTFIQKKFILKLFRSFLTQKSLANIL
jgi:hypothetical protein